LEMIKRPQNFRPVTVKSTSFSCSDDRDPADDNSLRTPGGDFAEFLYLLSWRFAEYNEAFTQHTVDTLFTNYLQWSPRLAFYYHTDDDAVRRIKASLVIDGEFDKSDFLDILNPPEYVQKALLRKLREPNNQGCLFLRLLAKRPSLFGVPRRAFRFLINSLFSTLWNQNKMGIITVKKNGRYINLRIRLYRKVKVIISQGKHFHGAWLNIKNSDDCRSEGIATLFPPHQDLSVVAGIGNFKTTLSLNQAFALAQAKAAQSDASNPLFDWREMAGMQDAPPPPPPPPVEFVYRPPELQPRQVLVYHEEAADALRLELALFYQKQSPGSIWRKALRNIRGIARASVQLYKMALCEHMSEFDILVISPPLP